jgi:hypothetical protein
MPMDDDEDMGLLRWRSCSGRRRAAWEHQQRVAVVPWPLHRRIIGRIRRRRVKSIRRKAERIRVGSERVLIAVRPALRQRKLPP